MARMNEGIQRSLAPSVFGATRVGTRFTSDETPGPGYNVLRYRILSVHDRRYMSLRYSRMCRKDRVRTKGRVTSQRSEEHRDSASPGGAHTAHNALWVHLGVVGEQLRDVSKILPPM